MSTPNGAVAQTALATVNSKARAIMACLSVESRAQVDGMVERAAAGIPPEPATDIDTLTLQIELLRERVNLLSPAPPSKIKYLHRYTWSVWPINPDPAGPDVYFSRTYHKPGEVSLTKTALYALARAASLQVTDSLRVDDGKRPFVRKFVAHVRLYTQDGPVTFPGSRELNLEDGSDQIKHLKPAQVSVQRARINELCETFAIERAIRGALSLQGSYTQKALAKPFFIAKCELYLDPNDPDQKALALKLYEQAQQALFGPAPVPVQLAPPDETPEPGEKPAPQLEAATPQPTEPEKQAPLPTPPPAPPKAPEDAPLPNIDVQEEIGSLAAKVSAKRKEAGVDPVGLSDIVQEFSSVKNAAGKTLYCRDPFDKRFEKSQKWARHTLKQLKLELGGDTAWMDDVDDSEVPE